jgi:hypothetical protein
MAYQKNTWVAPQGTNLNRFIKANETPTSVDLIQNPNITNNPTPFSAEWMNHLEDGVFNAHEIIDSRYGIVEMLYFQPTVSELAKMRLLPLEGQVITISTYQRLCDRMYVGDSQNATANFWYKISNPNDKSSRSTNGAYMVVADGRGMFYRGAGANAVFKAANNTPYDGGAIGAVIGDAIRNIRGGSGYNYGRYDNNTFWGVIKGRGGPMGRADPIISGGNLADCFEIDLTGAVPTAHENRPISISFLICISY